MCGCLAGCSTARFVLVAVHTIQHDVCTTSMVPCGTAPRHMCVVLCSCRCVPASQYVPGGYAGRHNPASHKPKLHFPTHWSTAMLWWLCVAAVLIPNQYCCAVLLLLWLIWQAPLAQASRQACGCVFQPELWQARLGLSAATRGWSPIRAWQQRHTGRQQRAQMLNAGGTMQEVCGTAVPLPFLVGATHHEAHRRVHAVMAARSSQPSLRMSLNGLEIQRRFLCINVYVHCLISYPCRASDCWDTGPAKALGAAQSVSRVIG